MNISSALIPCLYFYCKNNAKKNLSPVINAQTADFYSHFLTFKPLVFLVVYFSFCEPLKPHCHVSKLTQLDRGALSDTLAEFKSFSISPGVKSKPVTPVLECE